MQVMDVMAKEVHSCSGKQTLADAARAMWEHELGFLPVLNERNQLVSVVTDRDLCMGALFKTRPLAGALVEDVMSRRLITCAPDDDVADVEATMRRHQVRRLPVVGAEDRLVGVVALADVVRGIEQVTEAREEDSRRVPLRNPTVSGGAYPPSPDGDDIWIYE